MKLVLPILAASIASAQSGVTVPFVGCRSDGQVGPIDAPEGKPVAVQLPAATAQQLACYKAAKSAGVLAPRGWNCFSTYGSSGDMLLVSPRPIPNLLTSEWTGGDGAGIEIARSYGDTSGRFQVADVIARIFPAHRAFVKNVMAEGPLPMRLEFGPYPKDKLVYKTPGAVEYETPPRSDGLGTRSLLKKNDDPIRGVAMLVGGTPDLLLLSVRLPPALQRLAPAIIQGVEREGLR